MLFRVPSKEVLIGLQVHICTYTSSKNRVFNSQLLSITKTENQHNFFGGSFIFTYTKLLNTQYSLVQQFFFQEIILHPHIGATYMNKDISGSFLMVKKTRNSLYASCSQSVGSSRGMENQNCFHNITKRLFAFSLLFLSQCLH